MKRRFTNLLWFALGVGAAVGPAAADGTGWQIDASSYLWFPESTSNVVTPFGTASSTLGVSDALEALDFGLMGTVTARKGQWALVSDLFYLNLTMDQGTPLGVAFSGVDTEMKLFSGAGYGLYTISEGDGMMIEAGSGLRVMSSDLSVTLRGNGRPDIRSGFSDTWVDPLLAVRLTSQVSEGWKAMLWLDGGGFGIGEASDETWQATAVLTWQANEAWSISGGYRALYVERTSNGTPYDLKMSGPVFGVTYRF